MVTLTRILCPVDFSDCSRQALRYAASVGRWYGASVTALHVYSDRPVIDTVPAYRGVPLTLKEVDPAALLGELDAFVAATTPAVPIETEIAAAADASHGIVNHAAAIKADLVVMGTHGRTGVEHLILGSVAEQVVRQAARPVLLVPPGTPHTDAPVSMPFARIVCGLDLAGPSRAALDLALALAEEADADLTLVHAIEVPPELQVPQTMDEVDVAAARAAAEAEALQRLRDLVPEEARVYCRVHTDVREERADRALVETAIERCADVIVLGIRHHNALDRLLFGSNTQTVLRRAPCPVLAVPALPAPEPVEVA